MSNTKSFVLERYVTERKNPFKGITDALSDIDVDKVVSDVQTTAGVPPGSTSRPSLSSTPPKPQVTFMGQPVQPVISATGAEAERVGTSLVGRGTEALKSILPSAQTTATQAGKDVIDYAVTRAPATARTTGQEFTSGALSSLGTTLSKPANLAKLGAGALATGALIGGGMALSDRLFGRKKKKEKKGEFLASSFNPYVRSTADITGATGATAGTLGGLLGGKYLGARGADVLGLSKGSVGRTALEIGGQALGTVLGGTVGGILGYEAGKKRRKKKDNPMLPDMYRNA